MRKRRRERDDDRDRRPVRDRERKGNGKAKSKTEKKKEKAQRPFCQKYERTGKCAEHLRGGCRDNRHPTAWMNIGRRAAEAEKE